MLILGDSHKMKLNQTMTVCARQVMSQIGYITRDIRQVKEETQQTLSSYLARCIPPLFRQLTEVSSTERRMNQREE